MKRSISIVAIALMAVAVAFVSCKKDPKPTPTPQNPTAPTVAFVEGTDEVGRPYLVDGLEVDPGYNRIVACKVTCGDEKGVTVKLTGMFGSEAAFAPEEKQFMNNQTQNFNIHFDRGGDCVLTLTATDSYGQTAEKQINIKVTEFDETEFVGVFTCENGRVGCFWANAEGGEYECQKAVESALVVTKTGERTYKCQITIDGRTFETEGSPVAQRIEFACIDVEVPIGEHGVATVKTSSISFTKRSNDEMLFKISFNNDNGIPGTEVAKIVTGTYTGTMNQITNK